MYRKMTHKPGLIALVTLFLFAGQVIGKVGDDPAGERDVARLDFYAGRAGERLHDRQEGMGRQHGRFVRDGVDDFWFCHLFLLFQFGGSYAGQLTAAAVVSPQSTAGWSSV